MKIKNLLASSFLALLPSCGTSEVICTAENDDSRKIHFVIDATAVLSIMSATATKTYSDCWPIIPTSPPKQIHSCIGRGEGFKDFLEFDVNNLSHMTFYHTGLESNERLDIVTVPMRCSKSIGAPVETKLFE